MRYKLYLLLVTAFFVTMNVLLWRSEFGGRGRFGTPLPPETVSLASPGRRRSLPSPPKSCWGARERMASRKSSPAPPLSVSEPALVE